MKNELKNKKIKDLVDKLRPLSDSLKIIVFISKLLDIDEDIITKNNNINELLKLSNKNLTSTFLLERLEEQFSVDLNELRQNKLVTIDLLTKYILAHLSKI